MHRIIHLWHTRGPYALASGTYDPDELLPEKTADMAKHLARLGQNPMADVLRGVTDAYRRGDYEEALRRSEGLKLLGEVTAAYCFHRGANLGHLGRLDEAEVWLRRNIGMHEEDGRTQLQAIGFTALGQLMLQAARYQEAEECFEKSIALWPDRGNGYRYMAELCLLRGDASTDALRWAERAVSCEKASTESSAEILKWNLGEQLATLAWATAVASHDTTAVALLAGEAVASVEGGGTESTAQVEYQLGCAFTQLGDQQTAAQHYGEAARVDPNGHWGRVGKAALGCSSR
jgi:tetratricopeptide (TPR) repeat protein